MIKANELRIGNCIGLSDKLGSGNVVIEGLKFDTENSKDRIRYKGNLIWNFLEDFEPVPLSKEVLLACGFTPNRLDVLAIELFDISTHLELMEAGGMFYPSINQVPDIGNQQDVAFGYIQYLHELQNIYYFLCKKELEYKP